MHISDGVLSPYVVGIGWAIALPTLAVSVRRLRTGQVGVYGWLRLLSLHARQSMYLSALSVCTLC